MDVLIIGAGGHGKVVLDILQTAGVHRVVGFVDADAALTGTSVAGAAVLGRPNVLSKLRQQKIRGAIVAIGDNRARLRYAQLLADAEFELINAIHPSAIASSRAVLGKNIVLAAGSIVVTEAKIGDSVLINTGAIVDHECDIGAGAHICPGVRLAGRVRVGSCALIGLGANILPCLSIGEGATVGAGATVIADVPDHCTVVGVPARIIKTPEPSFVG